MSKLVYAFFDTTGDAERAIDAVIETAGLHGSACSIITHGGRVDLRKTLDHQTLAVEETDVARASARGAAAGAALGAALGALVAGPFGLLGIGPLAAAAFGAGHGTLVGALSAALVGAGLPDAELARIAKEIEAGRVFVSFSVDDQETAERVEAIVARCGGKFAEG